MIYVITAVPGSGKTLFTIDYFLKSGKFNGRPIFANIKGLQWDGVQPAPEDWRETPPGSLVIYDEAQEDGLYPATGKPGRPTDPRLTALETHRQNGYDLVFVTQDPTYIHHHIRKLAGKHIHLFRAARLQKAMVYEHDGMMDLKKLAKYSSRLWSFPTDLYDKYISTTADTHSGISLPRRIVLLALVILALVVFVAFNGIRAWNGFTAVSTVEDVTSGQAPVSFVPGSVTSSSPPSGSPWHASLSLPSDVPPPLSAAPEAPVAPTGCISFKKTCQCFGASGDLLLIPEDVCLASLKTPMQIKVRGMDPQKKEEDQTKTEDVASADETYYQFPGPVIGAPSDYREHYDERIPFTELFN